MPAKSSKPRAVDLRDAEWIARATRFSAHYRGGATFTVTEWCESAEAALERAAELTRLHGRYGRQACAYALTGDGRQAHITPALLRLSRQIAH